jgi:hypothetical protein
VLVVALEALQRVTADPVDPVVAQHAREEPGRGRAEAERERHLLLHDERALAALGRERRRDLAGDVGAADQHDVLGVGGVGADRVAVAERAQVVDAVEVAAVDPQAPDVGAGRQHRVAEGQLVAAGELRGLRGRVELHHARADPQVEPVGQLEVGPLAVELAAQVVLGAVRALVRRVDVAPGDDHRAAEAGVVQRRGARVAGRAGADDEDVDVSHRCRCPLRTRG